jgi:hypothetical protein
MVISRRFSVGGRNIPVEEEAEHLRRVEGGFGTHDVGNVFDGRKDGMEKDTSMKHYG